MAAPTLVQEAETSWNLLSGTDLSGTTASFDVLAGDLLVAFGVTADESPSLAIEGGSLTWTAEQTIFVTDVTWTAVWTATVDMDKSMTVTITPTGTGGRRYGANVLTFRDHGGVGASAKTNSTGAPSLDLTTTGANSAIVVVNGDKAFVDGTTRTWREGAGTLTEQTYFRANTQYTVYGGVHADAGAAGTYTVGLTAPTGQTFAIIALEVLAEITGLTTTLAPDAILADTNLSGAVTDIDEDPDSPDGNWLTADSATAATDLRVSFPSPPANPVGFQNFRYLVRKTTGSPTPTLTAELRQNNTLRATVQSAIPVTSTSGQVNQGTWSASSLATVLDGSDVELRLVSAPGQADVLGATPAYSATGQAAADADATITNAVTPAKPSTVNAGDLLILQVLARNDNNNGAGPATISGWTAFAGNPYGGTNNSRQSLYWRLASAGEASQTVSVVCSGGTTNDLAMARIYRFTAANGFAATPVEAISTNAGTASPLAAPSSVTPGGANRLAVCFGAIASSDATIGSMTGETAGNWTEATTANSTVGGDGTLNVQTADASAGSAIQGGSIAFTTSTSAHWNTVGCCLVPATTPTGAAVNTVEIGAVEWNVLYEDTGGAVSLAAVITASVTASAAITRAAAMATAVSATAAVTPHAQVTRPLATVVSVTPSVSAALRATRPVASAVSVTTGVTPALRRTRGIGAVVTASVIVTPAVVASRPLAAPVAANTAVTPTVQATRPISGAINASTGVTATLTIAGLVSLAATVQAVTTVTGALQAARPLQTAVSAATSIGPTLQRTRGVATAVGASPTVSPALQASRPLTSPVSAAVLVTPALQRALPLISVVSITPAVTPLAQVTRPLAAPVAATVAISAALESEGQVTFAASVEATSAVTSTMQVTRPLQSAVGVTPVVGGAVSRHRLISSAITASTGVAPALRRGIAYAAPADATTLLTAASQVSRPLATALTVVPSVSAVLSVEQEHVVGLAAVVQATSAVTPHLRRAVAIFTQITVASQVSPTAQALRPLSGTVAMSSSLTALLTRLKPLTTQISAASRLDATMHRLVGEATQIQVATHMTVNAPTITRGLASALTIDVEASGGLMTHRSLTAPIDALALLQIVLSIGLSAGPPMVLVETGGVDPIMTTVVPTVTIETVAPHTLVEVGS